MGAMSADGKVTIQGLRSEVIIRRDSYGIAHIEASGELDAWFGLGYCCATDRLFQMEYDRRRASGRLAELLGQAVVDSDILARRLGLMESAKRDWQALSSEVRSMFEAYAAGVNAWMSTRQPLLEEEMAGFEIERWEPWHSIAVFKVRHVLMGLWQHKLARAMLLVKVGEGAFSQLEDIPPVGSALSVPPEGLFENLIAESAEELQRASVYLGFLTEVEGGSNAWAVAGSRTSHGGAVLCGDAHRALEVPNVYWQAHLSCPSFDVFGGAFPGLPGFANFGHNGSVSWTITHAAADTQDLYVEEFDTINPEWYLVPGGRRRAGVRNEVIAVRGGSPVEIEVWHTRHGPVVHGDPRNGRALALRWTGFDDAHRGFEVLRPMLLATNVAELIESQREWVDPVNNFVAADVSGSIAYLTRGKLPIRSSTGHRRLPVIGRDDGNEWIGYVSFEDMPRSVDPPAGFVMSANNVITDGDAPYISASFADPFRAEHIRDILSSSKKLTIKELSDMQGDTVSWPACRWVRYLSALEPIAERHAEEARRMLGNWDGDLRADSAPALLYGCFRRSLAEALYRPLVGEGVWQWLISGSLPPTTLLIRRWFANDIWDLLGGPRPAGFSRFEMQTRADRVALLVPQALENAWREAISMAGPDPDVWQWGDHHYLVGAHPFSNAWDWSEFNPPRVPIGGDSDTIQAAAYGWKPAAPFNVSGLSVFRLVVDMADIPGASWVIPGGSSGDPRSAHFADQLMLWARKHRVSMSGDVTIQGDLGD